MTNKMPLAGRENFDALRSRRQRPFSWGPVVVEVHQDSTRARLEIVLVDGLEQVIERLLAHRIHRVTVEGGCEHEVKISVGNGLEQVKARSVGHVDVHENHIWRQFLNQPLRLFGTGCRLNDGDGWAGPADLATQEVSAMGLVVHDEGMKLSKHGRKV